MKMMICRSGMKHYDLFHYFIVLFYVRVCVNSVCRVKTTVDPRHKCSLCPLFVVWFFPVHVPEITVFYSIVNIMYSVKIFYLYHCAKFTDFFYNNVASIISYTCLTSHIIKACMYGGSCFSLSSVSGVFVYAETDTGARNVKQSGRKVKILYYL